MDIKTQEVEESSAVEFPEDTERKAGSKKKNKKKKKKPKSKEETAEEKAEKLAQIMEYDKEMAHLLRYEAALLKDLRIAFVLLIQVQTMVQDASPEAWRDVFQHESESSKRCKSMLIQFYSGISSLLKVQDRFQQDGTMGDLSGQLGVLAKIEAYLRSTDLPHDEANEEEKVIKKMMQAKEPLPGHLANRACSVQICAHTWACSKLETQYHQSKHPEVPYISSDSWLSDKAVIDMWAQAMAFAFKEGWEITVEE